MPRTHNKKTTHYHDKGLMHPYPECLRTQPSVFMHGVRPCRLYDKTDVTKMACQCWLTSHPCGCHQAVRRDPFAGVWNRNRGSFYTNPQAWKTQGITVSLFYLESLVLFVRYQYSLHFSFPLLKRQANRFIKLVCLQVVWKQSDRTGRNITGKCVKVTHSPHYL